MDTERGFQPLSSRACCAKLNLQFVTETPAEGLQPDQRFHIRSHAMKHYKHSQKRLQRKGGSSISNFGGITNSISVRPEIIDNLGWETDYQPQADAPALATDGPEIPLRWKLPTTPEKGNRSRQASNQGEWKNGMPPPSTPSEENIDTKPQLRCPYCGTPQAGSQFIFEDRVMDRRTSNATVLRRKGFEPDPLGLLGAGRVDPFQSYPVDSCSPYLHELMDHAITYLLPGLVPDTENNAVHPVSKAWLSSGLEHPLLFHAMAFAGSIHLDYLYSSQIFPDKPLSLLHKLVVIQKVNECLSDPDVASRDEVILAILILASHEAMNMSAGKENPFNSPLKNAQWLNIYSTITYVPEHMEAVLNLVTLRGGLENIKMFGLAEVIAAYVERPPIIQFIQKPDCMINSGDVVSASNSLSKPFCPLLRSSEAWLDYVEAWARMPPRPPIQKLASGFPSLQSFGIAADIMKVLGLLGAVTMAIDHYLRGEPGGLTLGAIAKVRTAAQHRILSLPLSIRLEETFAFNPYVYEACRTTTLIYGIAVVFPISNAYNLLHELARRLKALLIFLEVERYEPSVSSAYLWMLVLGGIAASDGPERVWYVIKLDNFATKRRVYDWRVVNEVLESFLWLDSACGAAGKTLWAEICTTPL